MLVKRIEPLQCAKMAGTVYAILGFIGGLLFSLFALMGTGLIGDLPLGGAMFGIGAVILLPIVYGCIGFVAGLIMAAIFNLAANWVGGIALEVE